MTEGRIFTSVEDWEREFFPDWSEKKDKEESCDNHIPFGVILANEALQKLKLSFLSLIKNAMCFERIFLWWEENKD